MTETKKTTKTKTQPKPKTKPITLNPFTGFEDPYYDPTDFPIPTSRSLLEDFDPSDF